MPSSVSPIALFAYNRPEHTKKTLEALSKNILADQSTLYIFCDGPQKNASSATLNNIKAVSEIVRKEQWAGEVVIKSQRENLGLAASVIKGVTEVIEKHGKVIVLEDDLVTSPGFLQYMNDALTFYESEDRVMHVSGYWFPVKQSSELLPETFFYRSTSCWGWGTWKRAWKNLETDSYVLKKAIGRLPDGVKRFNIENSYNHLAQLENNILGIANTWAVKWYASVFLNDGLCLHPNASLVNNIGLDNSGSNCDATTLYDWPELAPNIHVAPINLEENERAVQLLKRFYKNGEGGIVNKLRKRVLALLNQ